MKYFWHHCSMTGQVFLSTGHLSSAFWVQLENKMYPCPCIKVLLISFQHNYTAHFDDDEIDIWYIFYLLFINVMLRTPAIKTLMARQTKAIYSDYDQIIFVSVYPMKAPIHVIWTKFVDYCYTVRNYLPLTTPSVDTQYNEMKARKINGKDKQNVLVAVGEWKTSCSDASNGGQKKEFILLIPFITKTIGK